MNLTRASVSVPVVDEKRFKASLCAAARDSAYTYDVYSQNGVLRASVAYTCPDILNCCAKGFACTRQRPPARFDREDAP